MTNEQKRACLRSLRKIIQEAEKLSNTIEESLSDVGEEDIEPVALPIQITHPADNTGLLPATHVYHSGLSIRARKAVYRAVGVQDASMPLVQVALLTEKELLSHPHCGPSTVAEIKAKLKEAGLTLKEG